MSLAFAPRWPTATWPRLALVAGLAAHRALGAETGLKWPNDVLAGAGKVAGVLVEASGSIVVAGLGVNLWWPDAPDGVSALHDHDPGPDEMVAIAHRWAGALLAMVEAGPEAWGIDEYRAVCRTIDQDLTWEPDGRGRAIGVNDDGTLAVRTEAGDLALAASVVHEVRSR
jgi:BirA family biotin operon repressor/biotin-[acetyl-CoA-carboxylase] ligase